MSLAALNSDEDKGCLCQECGCRYKVDLLIPDHLWRRVGMTGPGGLLCGPCIMRRVEALGEYAALHATPEAAKCQGSTWTPDPDHTHGAWCHPSADGCPDDVR